MVLRTPRRRVSPQTKLKYRAIKKFFNRTLGNQSQSDINTYSNETITNDTTSFQFNDRNYLDDTQTETFLKKVNSEDLVEESSIEALLDREPTFVDQKSVPNTQVLYKKSRIKSESTCDYNEEYPVLNNEKNNNNEIKYDNMDISSSYTKERRKVSKKHKTVERLKMDDDWPEYSNDSSSSVVLKKEERNLKEQRRKKKTSKKEYLPINQNEEMERQYRKKYRRCSSPIEEDHSIIQYDDKDIDDVDHDFINEIIKRQYKPVTLFDGKYSEVSQITAPVCRDQDNVKNDNILEGDICSCATKSRKPKYTCYNDLSDARSVCDTRLYSNDKIKRDQPKRRKKYTANYNDSMYYDLVPVKEKQSPKSRQKYAENTLMYNEVYREVPPSPRTLRPRLNLDAQYHNMYEDLETEYLSDNAPSPRKCQEVYREMQLSGCSIDVAQFKNIKEKRYSSSHGDLNSGHDFKDEDTKQPVNQSTANVNTSQNSIHEDKTDKTLGEIKSILQTFLEEIKKESSAGDTEKSECLQNSTSEPQQDINASTFLPQLPNNNNLNNTQQQTNSINVNNNLQSNLPSPLFMPPFINPCCYPVLPFSPANCMQSSFVMPTQSACHDCTHVKETVSDDALQTQSEKIKASETDVLIKEIYKFIAQKSFLEKNHQKERSNRSETDLNLEAKVFTTRSVGSCRKLTSQNAKTGTPPIKCFSKSCEALVSYTATNFANTETTNYSDTLFTKSSQDATPLTSNFSSSTPQKNKETKFKNILQSIGFLKKKKSDLIEEKSENNVMAEIKDLHNKHPPFNQNITNCMMHEQEYFHPPPRPVPHYRQRSPAYDPDYDPRYSYRSPRYMSPPPGDGHYMPTNQHHYSDRPAHDWQPPGHDHHYSKVPYSPSYDPFYNQIPPQVPFCLKEIEVKSIATQSERKFKFFKRFASSSPDRKLPEKTFDRKLPEKTFDRIRDYSTQTSTSTSKKLEPTTTGPSFWRSWQEKALADHYRMDAEKFQQETQKKLSDGEKKIKNAMIKNLFHKRNPFSPNNLIIKTLLGKDQSSFGDPPKINTRPSMFV